MAEQSEKQRWLSFPWLRPFLVAVLAVAVPAVLYLWFYVGGQSSAWQDRARTALEAAAESMKREVELRSPLPEGRPQRCAPFSVSGATLRVPVEGAGAPCGARVFDLQALVPWALASGSFDYLLLADDRDRALAFDARLARRAEEDFFERKDGAKSLRIAAAPAAGSGAAKIPDVDAFRIAALPRVDALGTSFVVFHAKVDLPVTVDPPAGAKGAALGESLRLIGLASSDRIKRESLALSPVALVRIGALVLATFLVLPYLKIRFMGRRERLRQSDLWMLGAATLVATAGAALFVVHSYGLARTQGETDARLEKFAAQVDENFAMEVAIAERALRSVAPLLQREKLRLCGRVLASKPDCDTKLAVPADLQGYPFFEAIGIASQDKQKRKWMPRSPTTELANLSDYAWPKDALAIPKESGRFVMERVFANTSGLGLLVLAAPARVADGALEVGSQIPLQDRTDVAFIAMEPISLRAPAVPYPFEFAAVGEDGQVAFRSGSEGWPGENLLDGFEDREAMRDILALRLPTNPADHRYLGRMHRMSTRPLGDSPLVLVTFYDKREIEELSMLAVVSGASWIAMLLAVVAIGIAVLLAVESRALEWVWPSARRTPSYLAGIVGFLALAALLVAIRMKAPEKAIPHLLLLLPPLVLGLMSLPPTRAVARWIDARPAAARLPSRWYPFAYKAFVTAGLLTLIALPIAIASWDAVSAGEELFARHGAIADAARGNHHARGVRDRFRFEPPKAGTTAATTGASLGPAAAAPSQGDPEPEAPSRVGRPVTITARAEYEEPITALAKRLGVYVEDPSPAGKSPTTIASGCSALFPGSVAELPKRHFSLVGLWCWGSLFGVPPRWNASASLLAASHQTSAEVGSAPANAAVDLGALKSRVIWLALPLLLIVILVWRYVGSVSQQILGLELEGDGIVDRADDVSDQGVKHWLLLRPDEAALAAIRGRLAAVPHRIDLRDAALEPTSIAPAALPANRAVEIDHVERRLADAAWREALFTLICAPRRERLLLVAAIDPLYYLVTRVQDDPDGDVSWPEIQRWAAALQRVERVRFKLPTEERDCPGKHRDDVRLSERLAEECGWSARLSEIEATLRKRKDLYTLLWPQIVDYVLDAAEPYYREIWCLCTQEERLVLRQLAEEGLVNPRGFAVLRRLRRRRLVRIDPRVRLACESLRQFILEAEDPQTIRTWEASEETSSRVRGPLLAVGFVVATLFLLTIGPQVGEAVALAGAAGTLITAVVTVWTTARRGTVPS